MDKGKHFKHLTKDERQSIEDCIEHGHSKAYMDRLIGMDKSAIG